MLSSPTSMKYSITIRNLHLETGSPIATRQPVHSHFRTGMRYEPARARLIYGVPSKKRTTADWRGGTLASRHTLRWRRIRETRSAVEGETDTNFDQRVTAGFAKRSLLRSFRQHVARPPYPVGTGTHTGYGPMLVPRMARRTAAAVTLVAPDATSCPSRGCESSPFRRPCSKSSNCRHLGRRAP